MSDIVTVPPQSAGNSLPSAFRLSALRDLAAQPAMQRALPALGGLMAILLAAAAWYAFQTPTQRAVFEGLAEADKAAVADALQAAGISHGIDRSTGAVTVSEDDFHRARMMLAGQGLPKAAPSGDAMIGALPMGASRAVEGETLRSAREADLARTIEAIDAIKSARIHLAVPEPSPFLRDQSPPAASVMVTLQSGRTLSEAQVRAIGHLVASSVPGLDADQVAIVDQSGALLSQRDTTLDDRYLAQQAQIEDRARKAIAALLGPMLGNENYTAEIHADLDPSESQSTRESYPKDDRALRREEGNRTSGSATAPAAGIPGALSNQPPPASQVATTPGGALTPPGQAAPGGAGGTTDETYSRQFDVGREISVTHQPTGRLRRLTVAVALRDVKGAKPRTPQEIATIDGLVKGAVGFDAARGDVVAIAARPFADAAPPESVAFYDKPWFMTALRQGGALLAAVLAFFFIGRPMLKAARARAGRRDEEAAIASDLLDATAARAPVTLDMIEAEPSYEARANLVRDFVRQDPAKAASVVRQLMTGSANG